MITNVIDEVNQTCLISLTCTSKTTLRNPQTSIDIKCVNFV